MSIDSTVITGLIGLIGVFLGHALSERKSRNDELAKMRLDAYSDFLSATSNLFSARRAGRTKDELSELGSINDAKVRICVCADVAVVEALEHFWLQGGTLEKEQEVLAFTNLCRAMRKSLRKKSLWRKIQRVIGTVTGAVMGAVMGRVIGTVIERKFLGPERDSLPLDIRLSDILFKLEPSTYSYKSSREDG